VRVLLANAVRDCEPLIARDVTEARFLERNRPQRRTRVKGPLRDRSLGTKLTEVEYSRVESAAVRAGVGLSEWCRRAVLNAADRDDSQTPDGVLLAELLALRAVLLNVMFRMTNGDALSKEEMRQLIERADRDKHKRAAAVFKTGDNDAE
jgi:hypothetical protein